MTTVESILKRLTEEFDGSDRELYSEEELLDFARFYVDKWDDDTSGWLIAEAFVEDHWEKPNTCRRCSVCGKLMREGYCYDMGQEYYCSNECLHSEFTDKEWEEECNTNDQSYYTEWY